MTLRVLLYFTLMVALAVREHFASVEMSVPK
jgi:hypothetical protein